MHVGHHRPNPAHVVVLAARAGLAGDQLVDVALHGGFPGPRIRRVDRILLRIVRNAHVGGGHDETAGFAIQREGMHAFAQCQHQLGRRTVHRIARHQLARTGLQEGAFIHRRSTAVGKVRAAQHRKDGAGRNVHIDVRRAVERIEQQQVLALGVAVRNLVRRIHLLRGHRRKVAAPLVRLEQDFVGDHIQLLLHLALHVLAAGLPERIGQSALAHRVADRLDCARDHLDQKAQLGADALAVALLLDQELAEGDAGHGVRLRRVRKSIIVHSTMKRLAGFHADCRFDRISVTGPVLTPGTCRLLQRS